MIHLYLQLLAEPVGSPFKENTGLHLQTSSFSPSKVKKNALHFSKKGQRLVPIFNLHGPGH